MNKNLYLAMAALSFAVFVTDARSGEQPRAPIRIKVPAILPEDLLKDGRAGLASEDPNVMAHVGMMYFHGSPELPNRDEKAFNWSKKAAEKGNIGGMTYLALCYKHGRGTQEDQKAALKWFKKAADGGSMRAQFELGLCFHGGLAVPRDYKEAVKWYTMAANRGHSGSQHNLALCYARGQGVDIDAIEAYAWFNLASGSNPESRKARDSLERVMSDEDLTSAQERSKALQAQIDEREKNNTK